MERKQERNFLIFSLHRARNPLKFLAFLKVTCPRDGLFSRPPRYDRFGNPPCMLTPSRETTTISGCRFNCCDFTTPGAASQGGKWRGRRLLHTPVFQKVSKSRWKTRFRSEPKAGFPLHKTPPRRSAFLLSLFYYAFLSCFSFMIWNAITTPTRTRPTISVTVPG